MRHFQRVASVQTEDIPPDPDGDKKAEEQARRISWQYATLIEVEGTSHVHLGRLRIIRSMEYSKPRYSMRLISREKTIVACRWRPQAPSGRAAVTHGIDILAERRRHLKRYLNIRIDVLDILLVPYIREN